MAEGGRKGQIIVRIGADKSRFDKAMGKARKDLRKFADFSKRIAKGIALGVGAGIAGAAGAGVKAAFDLESARSQIAKATGAIGADLQAQFAAATEAMRLVPDAAGDVASTFGTLRTLVSGSDEEVSKLTAAVHMYSEIAGGEAGEVGFQLAKSMQAWGVGADQTRSVMDTLNQVSLDYGITGGKLTTMLQRYGPIFNNAGFSIQETAAVMGQLEARGLDVTRIGPGLNAFFRKVAQAGGDSRLELESLATRLAYVKDDAKALSIATAALGAEGAQRFLTAIRSGVQFGREELQGFVSATDGSLDATVDSSRTSIDKLKVLWSNLRTVIGRRLLPVLDRVTAWVEDSLPDWIAKARHLWEQTKTLAVELRDRLVPPLIRVRDAVAPIVRRIVEFIKADPVPFFVALGVAIGAIVVAKLVAGIISLTATIGALLAVLAGPAGIVVALAAVAGAVVWAYRNWEPFRNAVDATVGWFRDSFVPLLQEHVVPVLRRLGEAAMWLGDNVLRPLLDGVLKYITVAFEGWRTVLSGLIDFVRGVFSGDWSQAWEGIKTIVSGVGTLITELPGVMLTTIGDIAANVGPKLVELGSTLLGLIWSGIKTAWAWYWSTVPDLVMGWTREIAERLPGLGKSLMYHIGYGLGRAFRALVWDLPRLILTWLPGIVKGLADVGTSLTGKVAVGLLKAMKLLFIDLPLKIGGWLLSVAPKLIKVGTDLAGKVISGIVAALRKLPSIIANAVKTAIGGLASGAAGFVKGAFGFGAEGAVVTRPTLSLIGEAGPEAVVPLHKMAGARALPSMAGGAASRGDIYVTFNGDVYGSRDAFRELVVSELYEHERINGPLQLAGYAGSG